MMKREREREGGGGRIHKNSAFLLLRLYPWKKCAYSLKSPFTRSRHRCTMIEGFSVGFDSIPLVVFSSSRCYQAAIIRSCYQEDESLSRDIMRL